MSDSGSSTRLKHSSLGVCELVRTDGTDWIVRHLETGAYWRFPKDCRHYFTPVSENGRTATMSSVVPETTDSAESKGDAPRTVHHTTLGECELVRIEGVDWIIRPIGSDTDYRCPPQARRFLTIPRGGEQRTGRTPDRDEAERPSESRRAGAHEGESGHRGRTEQVQPADHHTEQRETRNPQEMRGRPRDKGRILRRSFESLRSGLPPDDEVVEDFAIGIDQTNLFLDRMLGSISVDGGNACVIRGAYGQGKTFSLRILRQRAMQAGYLVASTEVDAYENQLHKPHHIYRSLMSGLRLPDCTQPGVTGLLERLVEYLRDRFPAWHRSGRRKQAEEVRKHLEEETQCSPLAWLLSDPSILEREELISLLACEPGLQVGKCRRAHLLPGRPRDWPYFRAGTQGDFASFALCGLGRLARLLDYKGLLIILDEMEKWELLDWKAQSRAGNLFGGLIWGATAEVGSRTCRYQTRLDRTEFRTWAGCDHSSRLEHSGMHGGYQFSTLDRCFLGVAVAMTPRGEEAPEDDWSHYGVLEVIDLPPFSVSS